MKNFILLTLFLSTTFFSISQYNYSLEVESLNGKHPKEILDDISQHFNNHNRHLEGDMIVFESKVPISQEKMIKITELSGYAIKEFKLISTKEDKFRKEQEVK